MQFWTKLFLQPGPLMVSLILYSQFSWAQHRGDILAFQGLDNLQRPGVRALALGGAVITKGGEIDAVFWNPAGLAGLQRLQLTASFDSNNNLWRERQDYRPNRQLVTMSFILDGLYRPNPDFNGWIDSEAFLADSTYQVAEPVLGRDNYSEESADWQKELDDSGLNHIAAAYPFAVAGKSLVVSVAYVRQLQLRDYDRNQTHLVPHPAFDGYGDLPPRVVGAGDSVRITWSDFERQRSGPLKNYIAALALEVNENLNLGVSVDRLSGTTREFQSLSRIGLFDLVQGIQIFRFRYDTLDVRSTGSSDFSTTRFHLGARVQLGRLSLGANLTPGHTISREWRYTTSHATADSGFTSQASGRDELRMPLSYSVGLGITPNDRFAIAFDLEHKPYSKADFVFGTGDSTHRAWADQTSFRAGISFEAIGGVTLLAGYRKTPRAFIPDGAADSQRGPEAEAFSLGASLSTRYARLDIAYEVSRLKYYDAYFSNTNYAFERSERLLFGLAFTY